MNNKIDFGDLNDEQNTLLTLIAYININKVGRKKIQNGNAIKISKLSQFLDNPDAPYFGKMMFDENGFIKFDSFRGKYSPLSVTTEEMVKKMNKIGLGDVQITAVRDECGVFSSGFQAYALKDSNGNVGISYRGSDLDFTKGAIRDWVEADVLEYFMGTSTQVKQADEFFASNKHHEGKNYIYGASLGGNLTQHIYVRYYNEIVRVFTVNGNPINQKMLDTPEKIGAFNDPTKASFNTIGGDIVSLLKTSDLYPDTVHYIKNNETLRGLWGLESHLLEAGTYDENGNFVTTTREEAIKMLSPYFTKFTALSRDVREHLNAIEDKLVESGSKAITKYKECSKTTLEHLQKLYNEGKQLIVAKDNKKVINKKG